MGFRSFCQCGCGQIVSGFNKSLQKPKRYILGHNASKKYLSKSKGWLMKSGYRARYIHGKQVLEHRYLMEQSLGRKLREDECIDHINGIKSDNRIENLRICSKIQNEHYYHGISKNDLDVARDRLRNGYSYNESIKGTSIKSIATAFRLAQREGLR